MDKYLLALDQGTTSSRAILFDQAGNIVSRAQKEFRQIYPQPGWVEHDPMEIWATQMGVAGEALARVQGEAGDVAALGITNQRETTVVWERATGRPVTNAIVWQCRRTRDICRELSRRGYDRMIREKTGLLIDSYFSGTKLKWILDTVPGAREKALAGELLFGTIDTWLLWNLTGGGVHATDASNASRTLMYNIHDGRWDPEILEILEVPEAMLPRVLDSAGDFGQVSPRVQALQGIPIRGMAGDQQAALFGQGCFRAGQMKNTYGTGCFLLENTGTTPVIPESGLLGTVAWSLNGQRHYALEGSIFMGGAVIQWLRDELGLIASAADSEELARQAGDNGGVYLVPAFTGLGAPWWDMDARGILVGLTRGSGKPQIVRAALEAIAYQSRDVIDLMVRESGRKPEALRVDGGAVANSFLMQFQADILGIPVLRTRLAETTAWGAAGLAGLGAGIYGSLEQLQELTKDGARFVPEMDPDMRERLYGTWLKAVTRAGHWADGSGQ